MLIRTVITYEEEPVDRGQQATLEEQQAKK